MTVHLYDKNEAHSFALRLRRARIACAGVFIAALAVCILLCIRVNMGNWVLRRNLAIAVSALAGWIYILWLRPLLRSLRGECIHFESMLSQDTAAYTGLIHPDSAARLIPGSIRVRRVRLDCGDKEESFFVNERFAQRLPSEGRVTLYCAGSYIRDFEVQHERR